MTITWPSPPHLGQALAVTIWPSMLWRTRCTCPRPLHSLHVTGLVPSPAPLPLQRDRDGGAEHGLLEGDVGDGLEILPPRRAGRAPLAATAEGAAPTSTGAEERLEQVAEAAASEHVAHVLAARRTTDPLLAVAVVAGPRIGVAEHLIGLGDLLELLLGRGIAGVRIRVQLASALAVRLLQLLRGRITRDAEQLVVVSHSHHRRRGDAPTGRSRPRP